MSSSQNSSSSSDAAPAISPADPLGWVMDVPCPVDFVLGSAVVKVHDCVRFVPGSVVTLKQAAGSDLELRVSGVPIAAGEVVMVDDNLGLRLSRVLPPVGQEFA